MFGGEQRGKSIICIPELNAKLGKKACPGANSSLHVWWCPGFLGRTFGKIFNNRHLLFNIPAFIPQNDKGIWICTWEAGEEVIKLNESITNTATKYTYSVVKKLTLPHLVIEKKQLSLIIDALRGCAVQAGRDFLLCVPRPILWVCPILYCT